MTKPQPPIDEICQTLDNMDGTVGIGKTLFESISRLTPAVSVELIIKSQDQRSSLLTWRDDELYGPGWHVPGGVVRFKETLTARVEKVLKNEVAASASKIEGPIGFHEIFNEKRDKRGHFICFVYKVILVDDPPFRTKAQDGVITSGSWRWFAKCPDNLIENQRSLVEYIDGKF
jgi:ADP-ribose pyrophosphatase YjhB (NUDIX family)